MNEADVSLSEQAIEVELQFRGLRDLHERAQGGKFKRSPHEIERLARRRDIAEVAARTLRDLAKKEIK